MSAPDASTGASTDDASRNTSISGNYEVDGRSMYIECRGSGSPTVVLIGGLRAAADYWDRAGQTLPTVGSQVAEFTRVCAYDRPGTVQGDNTFSRSEAVAQPSSQASAVTDLHELLAVAGVQGPYVLAAHSYGGFVARAYAAAYPEEVTGLVLIDALSEGFQTALTPEEYSAWKESQRVSDSDVAEYPGIERLDEDAVMAEMRATPPIHPMPLTVLSADRLYGPGWADLIRSGSLPADTPPELGYAIDAAQRSSQELQAALLPDAVHITNTHSGHDIPLENPGIVVEAIRDIVLKLR
ncbi:MAG: alpha/beta fold hydrolase [Leucobacter sp.]